MTAVRVNQNSQFACHKPKTRMKDAKTLRKAEGTVELSDDDDDDL